MSKKTTETTELTPSALPTPEITIGSIKEFGIKLKSCTFHKAIKSLVDGTPEYTYYDSSNPKANRIAKMWYYRDGVLMAVGDRHKILPLAQIAETEVL